MSAEHRLASVPGGHPVIPLPVHWRMGAHGDPIAEFDYIVLHLHPGRTSPGRTSPGRPYDGEVPRLRSPRQRNERQMRRCNG